MNTHICQLRVLLLGAAFIFGAVGARADLLDGQDDPLTIPLAMQVNGGGPYASYFGFSMTANGVYVANYTGYLPNFSVPPVYVSLTPEATTSIVVTASGFNGWAVTISAPRGYTLYIDGQPGNSLVRGDLNPGEQITVVYNLTLHRSRSGGLPGEASRIRNNSFYWAVGLGTTQNGSSAGTLMIHQAVCPTTATRALIDYAEFCPGIEALSDSIGLRQVLTPGTLVNLWDLSSGTGFQIDFYPASAASPTTTNGFYTFSGSPYISYQITAATSGTNKTFTITRLGSTPNLPTSLLATTDTNSNQVNYPGNLRVVTDSGSNNQNNTWVDTITTTGGNGHTSSVIAKTYENFPWGQQLIKEVDDPNGNAYTTTYAYNQGVPTEGGYGQLASVTYPDGSWVAYSYYDSTNDTNSNGTPIAQFGELMTEFHPWQNGVTNPANATLSNCRAVTYTYAQDWNGKYTLEASRVETINGGTVASRSTANNLNLTANNLELWTRVVSDSSDSSHVLTTTTKAYMPSQPSTYTVFEGQPYSTQHPDGTMESYATFPLDLNTSTHALEWNPVGAYLEQIVLHGVTPSVGSGVSGAASISSLGDCVSDHTNTVDTIWLIPNQSTETITYRQAGSVYLQQDYVYTASGFQLVSWTESTYTPSWKLSSTTSSNGATTLSQYVNEFKTQDLGPTGVTTTYTPDALLRISSASRLPGSGYSGPAGITLPTAPIITSYSYDSDNNVTQTQVSGSSTGLPNSAVTLTTGSIYNLAGRLTSQTDANGLTTSYSDSQGGLVQTTTFPGTAIRVVTRNLDGSVSSVTGAVGSGAKPAQVPTYYSYALLFSSGFLSVQKTLGTLNSHNWTVVESDWLGRKVVSQAPNPTVSNPTPTSGAVTTTYSYNSLGQLVQTSTPGIASTLFSYTPMGALEMTAVDVNGNGAIDVAGSDRVSQTDTFYSLDSSGKWWLDTAQGTYATPGSSVETIVKTTGVQLSGLTGASAVTTTTDADNNVTTQTTTVNGNVATTVTSATGLTGTAQQVSCNGLLVSQTSINGNTTTYGYDGIGRPIQVTDPRKGAVDTVYYPGTNQIELTQYDNSRLTLITEYTYGADGRVASQVDAQGNTKSFTYDSMGDVLTNSGTGTPNVTYTYDTFGRMGSQTTWYSSGNAPALVTFSYDGDLALLSGKEDALQASVSHTYDSLGRESTRTDSRGVVKTSSYDPATGDLLGCVYTNDPSSTKPLAYTYTRTGQLLTVTDAAGQRKFSYNFNFNPAKDLQIASEALPACFGSNGNTTRNIIYNYVRQTGGPSGLLSGINLSNSSITSNDQSTTYGYDLSGGRLSSVSANGAGFSAYTFNYSYAPESELLVAGVSNTSTGFSQTYTYDPHHDLITDITTAYGGATDTKYDYTYDSLNRRATAVQSGNVFIDYGGSTSFNYGYDGQGEILSAVASLNGTTMPGRAYSYSYDSMGNRLSADHTGGVQGLAESYTPNPANQITSKENTTVAVQGNAASAANVVVQSTLAARAGNYWASEALLANTSGPAYSSISVFAGQAGAGSGGTDLVSQNSIMAFLLPFNQTISYDPDGDVSKDGQWNYTWDAEHRLIGMVTNTTSQGVGLPQTQVAFTYDYLGRRISKTVTVGSGQPTVSQYVYFGWNVAAELDGSGNLKRHFIWGLDRSGTTSGLGGVGGLLMIQDSGHTYFPAYDGGANVAALLDASNSGAYAATYEYSPFGELLRKQGQYAISNPFRFSTKWWDEETGFSYYGLRYYNSVLGRFISRDPIEELGGINLYAFCGNSPINGFDLLGMKDPPDPNDPTSDANVSARAADPIGSVNSLGDVIGNMYNGEGSGDWVMNWLNPGNFNSPALPDPTNSVSSIQGPIYGSDGNGGFVAGGATIQLSTFIVDGSSDSASSSDGGGGTQGLDEDPTYATDPNSSTSSGGQPPGGRNSWTNSSSTSSSVAAGYGPNNGLTYNYNYNGPSQLDNDAPFAGDATASFAGLFVGLVPGVKSLVGGALGWLGDQIGELFGSAETASTDLSTVRFTQDGESFIRYETGNPAFSRVTADGGLLPGTYAAPVSEGVQVQGALNDLYNLPSPELPRTNYFQIYPPAGTPVIGPGTVTGGSGSEVIFPSGVPAGSVGPVLATPGGG